MTHPSVGLAGAVVGAASLAASLVDDIGLPQLGGGGIILGAGIWAVRVTTAAARESYERRSEADDDVIARLKNEIARKDEENAQLREQLNRQKGQP